MSKRSEAQPTIKTIYPGLVEHMIKTARRQTYEEMEEASWNDYDEAMNLGFDAGVIINTRNLLDRFGIPEWRK